MTSSGGSFVCCLWALPAVGEGICAAFFVTSIACCSAAVCGTCCWTVCALRALAARYASSRPPGCMASTGCSLMTSNMSRRYSSKSRRILERVDLPLEVLPKLGLRVILVHWAEKLAQRLTNRLALLLKDPPRHTLRELLHDLRPFGFQLVQELVRAHGGLRLSELLCRVLCSGLLIALHRLRLLEVGQE